MSILKSDTIILSVRQSGEGDIIAKALTSDSGKRNFIFKGLKKSRRRPQVEPGLRVEIIYYYDPVKNIHPVKEFSIKSETGNIRNDLNSIYHMMYILESAERTSTDEEKIQGLFPLVSSGIETLTKGGSPELVTAFYTIRLLKILGILHDFSLCIKCGRELDMFSINSITHGPLCTGCSGRDSRLYGKAEKNFIRISSLKKFREIEPPADIEATLKSLHGDLMSFLESYCGAKIKSGKLICKDI